MSTHIGGAAGAVAPRVLLPGDPLRARWIAETFLDDAQCYSRVRNMFGYTGLYRGERVSVQGTGMGLPSMSIYATELMRDYGAQQLVRVGSCGALVDELALRDVVLAISASTDSAVNRVRFEGLDFAPTADFSLLRTAYEVAVAAGAAVRVGPIFSGDSFYSDRPELLERMSDYGVIAVEMETAALYTLAAKHHRRALAVCTVSDHMKTGEETTSEERERTFTDMVEIALDTMLAVPLADDA
jgi:purine-nucleoside phosphorylase